MKLSELRPCDKCGGKIAPMFYVLRISQALFTPAAGQTLHMARYLNSLEIGELFAPESDDAVMVVGDQEKALMTELLICQPCFLGGPVDLAILCENRINQREAERKKRAAETMGEEAQHG